MEYEDIIDTINTINRAATALGVTPNEGTFTAKEFRNTQLSICAPTLNTLRRRGAVVVDHVETFTVSAKADVSIDRSKPLSKYVSALCWYTVDRLNVYPQLPDYVNVEDVFHSGKLLNALADLDEDVQMLLSRYGIDVHDYTGISVNGDCSTFSFSNGVRVSIVFRPELEGRRNFYRFDLMGFLKKNRAELDAAADRAENKAKQLVRTSKEYKALAARIRDMIADINDMD